MKLQRGLRAGEWTRRPRRWRSALRRAILAPPRHGARGFTSGNPPFEHTEITGELQAGPQALRITLYGLASVGAMPMCDPALATREHCVDGGYWINGTTSLYRFGSYTGAAPYPEMRLSITAITGRRVTGTFEGFAIGTCTTCNDKASVDTVYFTNGKFDVPHR